MTILTLNVDGLHQRAGSGHVIELHGTLSKLRCLDKNCGGACTSATEATNCPDCGGPVRPDIVLVGESVAPQTIMEAKRTMRDCDLLLAVGIYCRISTADRYVRSAVFEGARLVRVHPVQLEPVNPDFPENLIGKAEEVVPALVA